MCLTCYDTNLEHLTENYWKRLRTFKSIHLTLHTFVIIIILLTVKESIFTNRKKYFIVNFEQLARKMGLADIRSSAILAVSCPIVQRQLYSEVIYVLPGEAWRRFYPSANTYMNSSHSVLVFFSQTVSYWIFPEHP